MMSELVLLALALVAVALLTAGGMAMRSVSRIWLRHWVEQQLRGARAALTYLERPHRMVIAANACIAIIIVLSGELLASEHDTIGDLAWAMAWFAAAVIAFGQLLPRALARRFAPQLAAVLSPLLQVAAFVASPVVIAGRIAGRPRDQRNTDEHSTDRETLQELLREGELEGVGAPEEMEIITGVMEFGEKAVGDVMIPREDIFFVTESAEPREIAEEFATSAFSRVPVVQGTLDNVIGMIHVFDVLKLRGERRPELRPVAQAVASTPCSELLFRMLRQRKHLAIVQDADHHTIGLVTLEDLLEELVGDIRDEHDEPALPPDSTN